jgi:hypothetical protein
MEEMDISDVINKLKSLEILKWYFTNLLINYK